MNLIFDGDTKTLLPHRRCLTLVNKLLPSKSGCRVACYPYFGELKKILEEARSLKENSRGTVYKNFRHFRRQQLKKILDKLLFRNFFVPGEDSLNAQEIRAPQPPKVYLCCLPIDKLSSTLEPLSSLLQELKAELRTLYQTPLIQSSGSKKGSCRYCSSKE